MITQKLNNELPIIFLGDHHGDWSNLFYLIDRKKIKDCYLISVGDSGIGFESKNKQLKTINRLDGLFEEKNIYFKSIRGNHDNPFYYQRENRINLKHFELIEDYSVYEYNSKLFQFIGGAVSIDRTGRREGISHWAGEGVMFDKSKCCKVDVLITHTAPSYCFPQQFNEMVYGWAREDAYLLEDLTDERAVMDEIFKICSPGQHFYGHFHSTWTERVNGCVSKLLDINELYEYK
jgi:hypothetical protein